MRLVLLFFTTLSTPLAKIVDIRIRNETKTSAMRMGKAVVLLCREGSLGDFVVITTKLGGKTLMVCASMLVDTNIAKKTTSVCRCVYNATPYPPRPTPAPACASRWRRRNRCQMPSSGAFFVSACRQKKTKTRAKSSTYGNMGARI